MLRITQPDQLLPLIIALPFRGRSQHFKQSSNDWNLPLSFLSSNLSPLFWYYLHYRVGDRWYLEVQKLFLLVSHLLAHCLIYLLSISTDLEQQSLPLRGKKAQNTHYFLLFFPCYNLFSQYVSTFEIHSILGIYNQRYIE